MASIRLETICCLVSNNTEQHNPHDISYVTYNALCIVSATVSILGALYQIVPCVWSVPAPARSDRYIASPSQRQNYIIVWLAVADLLASLGILVRAATWAAGYSPWPLDSTTVGFRRIFCAVSAGWIQYFYVCTYAWTICYAADVHRTVHSKSSPTSLYHLFSWLVTGLLCLLGLLPYYTPKLTQCGTELSYSLPHYLVAYVPIAVVMVGNPVLYYFTQREVQSTLRSRGLYTNQERAILKSIQTKFFMVMLVFYVCWTPNIIDGILMIFQYKSYNPFLVGLWHFMALVNPLQALLNSLVYRGVNCFLCCRSLDGNPRRAMIQASQGHLEESNEVSPLLSFRKSGSRST